MPEINKDWIAEQLQGAKVKVGSGKAIIKLLEAWSEIPKLSDNMVDEVLSVFSVLAKGHSIVKEENEEDYTWVPLQPGKVVVGDVVRVKADAYDNELGPIHNGRRGKVVGIRYGEIYIKSTDGKTPTIDGTAYSPYKLEKRIYIGK
jgi:hypothetical protein